MVLLYLLRLAKQGLIDKSFAKAVDFNITTGSAALGRGTEFNSITAFTEATQAVLGEQFSTFIKIPELVNRIATSLDISTSELIKSEDELKAEAEAVQAQEQQLAAIGPSINAESKQE